MIETTKEILDKYQVRKSKKQKQAFRDYLKNVCEENNYEYREEKGYCGATNVIVGDVDKAKVIYTAHYDTQAVLPIPYIHMPKKPILTIFLQILMFLPFMSVLFGGVVLFRLLLNSFGVTGIALKIIMEIIINLSLVIMLLMPYIGKTNKHTANDNTSGVTTLIDIMISLPIENREAVAFVFFDLEEMGLLGSAGFAKKHKDIKENKLVVNFDCVSNGKKILFVLSKTATKHLDVLKNSFVSTQDYEVEFASKWVYYPSDQRAFKCGVGVAALNKKHKFEYLSKIHSSKDTIYDEKNIEFLVDGAKKLIDEINKTN